MMWKQRAQIAALTNTLSEQSKTIVDLSIQLKDQWEQSQRKQKELAMQMEELYDQVSGKNADIDAKLLLDALIALRDEAEDLRMFANAREDEGLRGQVDLFTRVCDRKLTDAGIQKLRREGEPYNQTLDIVSSAETCRELPHNTVVRELSGCYSYGGTVVKRAAVVINQLGGVNE